MQRSQQNSLAVQVEMKALFSFLPDWTEPNKSQLQHFLWMILTSTWQGQDWAACLHTNENEAFFKYKLLQKHHLGIQSLM